MMFLSEVGVYNSKMEKLSPRGYWILNNTKPGKILHIGFAGSDDEPAILYEKTIEYFQSSDVYGVDINRAKIKKLNLKNTFYGNGKKLPFKSGLFDCVVLAEVLEHQTEPYRFLTEAYRVLKPNGTFLITTPSPFGIFRWLKHFIFARNLAAIENVKEYLGFHDHKMFFGPLSLIALIYSAGFKLVTYSSTNLSVPYFTKYFGEIQFQFWPFDRLGTYSCYKAIK